MQTPRIFGREPSAILGLVAVAVQFFSAFVMDVSQNTQTLVNAVAAAAVGLVVAWMVHDGVIAAISGLAAAALALGMNLGLDWSTDKQAAWMAGVMFAAHWFVRTQVTAPVQASAPKAALPR
ncbi:hypothetical protein [Streptomyces sp. NPDC047939]|uniref:hypothetical protein n=1 Tax=Streptomyces sp. NPDC047939 TaxID=3155381 RepID=UPI00343311DB